MKTEKSLKAQNIPLISLFLVWGVSLYIVFLMQFTDFWSQLTYTFENINVKNGCFITLVPLLVFIMSHLLNANQKAILVFWKINNPLPGSRAFTEIGPKDPRVDMNLLISNIKEIPYDPIEQNRTWYKLYKQVSDSTAVSSSHKNFLLARDLTAISFLFILFTPWSILLVNHNVKMVLCYILIWLLHYLILRKVAINNGERFVSNVLAEYCSETIILKKL